MAKATHEQVPAGQQTEGKVLENLMVIRIEGENFKVLQTVDCKLDDKGNLIPVSGANGSGKSSLIDLVMAVLSGKGAMPAKPIRKGETRMLGRVTLGTRSGGTTEIELIVVRKAEKKGDDTTHSLKVTTPDGSEIKSPQQLLDAIVGDFTFDPYEFTFLSSADKRRALCEACGVQDKLDAIDSEIKRTEEERLLVGRDKKAAQGHAQSLKAPEGDVPNQEVSVEELTQEYKTAQEQHMVYRQVQSDVDAATRQHEQSKSLVEQLRSQLATAEATVEGDETRIKVAQEAVAKAKKGLPDLEAITTLLQNADATNRAVRAKQEYQKATETLADKSREYEKLSAIIDRLREQPAKVLADTNIGISGLTLEGDVICLNGIPLDQCATSEQLVVGVRIGMLKHPALRTMFIRDGSLLDESTLRKIGELAGAEDYQIIYEAVDTSGELGFVLQQGIVVHEPEAVEA